MHSRSGKKWFLAVPISLVAFAPLCAEADHIEEVIIYDTAHNADNQDEGLVRQRLGLLDGDGNPDPDNDNILPPLVSGDGLKLGINLDAGDTFVGGYGQLKLDAGVMTVLLHGRRGVIQIGARSYKGFGAGTGNAEACNRDPYQLDDGGGKTNMTIHLVICQAGAGGSGITPVATTLRNEIVSLGGSVTTLNSFTGNCQSIARRAWRKRAGATMSAADSVAANTALQQTLIGTDFKDKWKTLQQRLDTAVAPDGTGSRAIARMLYIGKMGGTEIQKMQIEGLYYDDEISECAEECPLSVSPTTWGRLKAGYR